MTSAERVIQLSDLVTRGIVEVLESDSNPIEEFSLKDLATAVTLSVMSLGQELLLEEGSNEVITLEDIVEMIEEGLEEVSDYVVGINP